LVQYDRIGFPKSPRLGHGLIAHHQWTAPVNRRFPQRSTNKFWLAHGGQSPVTRNRAAESPHLRHLLDSDDGWERRQSAIRRLKPARIFQAIFETARFS
jgi:hypothetical protein